MNFLRLAFLCCLFSATSWAQATRTWEQTKYDEFEKGTAHGVAMLVFGGFPLLLIVVGAGCVWIAAMDLKAKKGEAGHDTAA